jgi:hypothetical protein
MTEVYLTKAYIPSIQLSLWRGGSIHLTFCGRHWPHNAQCVWQEQRHFCKYNTGHTKNRYRKRTRYRSRSIQLWITPQTCARFFYGRVRPLANVMASISLARGAAVVHLELAA